MRKGIYYNDESQGFILYLGGWLFKNASYDYFVMEHPELLEEIGYTYIGEFYDDLTEGLI